MSSCLWQASYVRPALSNPCSTSPCLHSHRRMSKAGTGQPTRYGCVQRSSSPATNGVLRSTAGKPPRKASQAANADCGSPSCTPRCSSSPVAKRGACTCSSNARLHRETGHGSAVQPCCKALLWSCFNQGWPDTQERTRTVRLPRDACVQRERLQHNQSHKLTCWPVTAEALRQRH